MDGFMGGGLHHEHFSKHTSESMYPTFVATTRISKYVLVASHRWKSWECCGIMAPASWQHFVVCCNVCCYIVLVFSHFWSNLANVFITCARFHTRCSQGM